MAIDSKCDTSDGLSRTGQKHQDSTHRDVLIFATFVGALPADVHEQRLDERQIDLVSVGGRLIVRDRQCRLKRCVTSTTHLLCSLQANAPNKLMSCFDSFDPVQRSDVSIKGVPRFCFQTSPCLALRCFLVAGRGQNNDHVHVYR